MAWYIVLGIATAAIIVAVILISYCCYVRVFFVAKKSSGEDIYFPKGEAYKLYEEQIRRWIEIVRETPCRVLKTTSFDGLVLQAKYYEYEKNAPIEILFHGYKSNAERDLSGALERCFALGHSAVLVDQRASGSSQGKAVTFGIKERLDCLSWIDFCLKEFKDETFILGGVSMGASTVMSVADQKLPSRVKYIIADCGFTSPKEIIKKVIADKKLPVFAVYPFIAIGAKLFVGIGLDSFTAKRSLKNATVPVIFFHGEADDFVPCDMSKTLYDVCSSKKRLVLVKGAGHGLAYPVDKNKYLSALKEFESSL